MFTLIGAEGNAIVKSLKDSYSKDKGVPNDLDLYFSSPNDYFGYYSSSLSTYLLALYKMDLLTKRNCDEIQETLLHLRDNTQHPIIKNKYSTDAYAWSVSEGPCVFATAWAIWALLETNYQGHRLGDIKSSSEWLLSQQREDGGFGFDISCESRTYYTALALHALRLSRVKLTLAENERGRINRSIKEGIDFILVKREERGEITGWKINTDDSNFDPTSTLYAIWALHEEDKTKYQSIIERGLKYLKCDLSSKDIWDITETFSENSEKYGIHKKIVTFTPSFPLVLLRLGVSPFDELCIKPIVWLKNNQTQKGWPLKHYTSGAVSFTTALGLWTIYEWEKSIIRGAIKEVIIMKGEKCIEITAPRADKLRKRVMIFSSLFIASFCYLFVSTFTGSILTVVQNIPLNIGLIEKYILVVTVVGGVLGFFGIVPNIESVKRFDEKYLNRCIKRLVHKVKKTSQWMLYGY